MYNYEPSKFQFCTMRYIFHYFIRTTKRWRTDNMSEKRSDKSKTNKLLDKFFLHNGLHIFFQWLVSRCRNHKTLLNTHHLKNDFWNEISFSFGSDNQKGLYRRLKLSCSKFPISCFYYLQICSRFSFEQWKLSEVSLSALSSTTFGTRKIVLLRKDRFLIWRRCIFAQIVLVNRRILYFSASIHGDTLRLAVRKKLFFLII